MMKHSINYFVHRITHRIIDLKISLFLDRIGSKKGLRSDSYWRHFGESVYVGGLSGFLRGGGGTGVFRQNKEKSVHESARSIRFWGGGGVLLVPVLGVDFWVNFDENRLHFDLFHCFWSFISKNLWLNHQF